MKKTAADRLFCEPFPDVVCAHCGQEGPSEDFDSTYSPGALVWVRSNVCPRCHVTTCVEVGRGPGEGSSDAEALRVWTQEDTS